eukprot:gene8236-16938_t
MTTSLSSHPARQFTLDDFDNICDDVGFLSYLRHTSGNNKRIVASSDWRNFEDLKRSFPSVDTIRLQLIWESHSSWLACYYIAQSMLYSHGFTLTATIDINLSRLDVTIWPPLFYQFDWDHSDKPAFVCSGNDWTIVDHSCDDSLSDSWEMLSDEDTQSSTIEPKENDTKYKPKSISQQGKLSYRDMLLSKGNTIVSSNQSKTSNNDIIIPKKAPWTPLFALVVVKNQRVNVEYGNVHTCTDITGGDDNGNDGMADLMELHYHSKAAVGACRFRNSDITRLSPQRAEKKLARQAVKIA